MEEEGCNTNESSECDTWSLDGVKKTEEDSPSPRESPQIVRKFINSAIYIEKPLSASVSSGNTSISQKFSNDDLLELQTLRTKRCTCTSDKSVCPCHANNSFASELEKEIAPIIMSRRSSTKLSDIKTKVSSQVESKEKPKRVIKNRTATKEAVEQKKRPELSAREKSHRKDASINEEERELMLEKERENFKNWLMNKKKAENEVKKKKQKEGQMQEIRDLEKQKRDLENQLNFQLWLKKKEEAQLEQRIKQQIQLIAKLERKERNLKDNEKAFNDWLVTSKDRQKPTPLNRGLRSLCSSTSVAYINPNPWHQIT